VLGDGLVDAEDFFFLWVLGLLVLVAVLVGVGVGAGENVA
jgi:hypothetical protein